MSIIITPDDSVHVFGDSITDANGVYKWHLQPGSLKDWLQGPALGYSAFGPASPRPRAPVPVTTYGVSGANIADVAAAFNTWIGDFDPTVLISAGWINDGVDETDPATFATSLASVTTAALALNPDMKFIFGNCMAYGELWAAGPIWGANAHDDSIDDINGEIEDHVADLVTAGVPAVYVDWREQVLLMEGARNAPAASSAAGGRLFVDNPGLHPSHDIPDVIQMMAATVRAQIDLQT